MCIRDRGKQLPVLYISLALITILPLLSFLSYSFFTVDNVEIISSITAEKLKATGTVVSSTTTNDITTTSNSTVSSTNTSGSTSSTSSGGNVGGYY